MTTAVLEKFLEHLSSPNLLLTLAWEEWLAAMPPYRDLIFSVDETTVRFSRNGYD